MKININTKQVIIIVSLFWSLSLLFINYWNNKNNFELLAETNYEKIKVLTQIEEFIEQQNEESLTNEALPALAGQSTSKLNLRPNFGVAEYKNETSRTLKNLKKQNSDYFARGAIIAICIGVIMICLLYEGKEKNKGPAKS